MPPYMRTRRAVGIRELVEGAASRLRGNERGTDSVPMQGGDGAPDAGTAYAFPFHCKQ